MDPPQPDNILSTEQEATEAVRCELESLDVATEPTTCEEGSFPTNFEATRPVNGSEVGTEPVLASTRDGLVVAKFIGHKDQVLCVDVPETAGSNLVATSSDDGTCRVWDVRTRKSVKCIPSNVFRNEPVTAVKFCPPNDHVLFAAAGNSVSSFDLRGASIIVSQAMMTVNHSEDEINEISIRSDGKVLTCGDDTGAVFVLNTSNGSLLSKLQSNGHTNICTATRFHPRARSMLASGGLDSNLITWDFTKGKPLHSSTISSMATGAQLVNPPFVNSLCFTPHTGTSLAAGLGDGTVSIYDSYSMTELVRKEVHSAPVCAVAFDWAELESNDSQTEHRVLYTGANDSTLAVWNVNLTMGSSAQGSVKRGRKKGKKSCSATLNPIAADMSLAFRVEHGAKPNWMAPSPHSGGIVFVADTSNDLSMYSGMNK